MRGLFVYLVDEDYCTKNPVRYRYYVEEERRLPRPMSEKDQRIFVAHLKTPRDRAVFLLMLRTGLRVGEVSRLQVSDQVSDLHWPPQNLLVYTGKGKVDRVVYFSDDGAQALQLWLHTRGDISAYCFAAHFKRERPVNKLMIRHWMAEILGQCGLGGKGYTPQTLRHTFATNMVNAGMDLTVLRDLMGHKNSNRTLSYALLSNQSVRDSYYRAVRQVEDETALIKEAAAG